MLGLALGQGGFALGQQGFALGPQGFLDTNMFVSPMQNSRVGGPDQHKAPTREFRVAVGYRLNLKTSKLCDDIQSLTICLLTAIKTRSF